jgi:hypothetical protein
MRKVTLALSLTLALAVVAPHDVYAARQQSEQPVASRDNGQEETTVQRFQRLLRRLTLGVRSLLTENPVVPHP